MMWWLWSTFTNGIWSLIYVDELQDLLDEEMGYYNQEDDTVTLEVHVAADEPQVTKEDNDNDHGGNWTKPHHVFKLLSCQSKLYLRSIHTKLKS